MKKRSLAISVKNPSQPQISAENKKRLQSLQNALKSGDYQRVLDSAPELERAFEEGKIPTGNYLTTLLWQIRAAQALKGNDLDDKIRAYIQKARDLEHIPHLIQGLRVRAQVEIERGNLSRSLEYLNEALDFALGTQDGKNAFELLMHLSSIEIQCCKYCDALDHLGHGLQMLPESGLPFEENREIQAVGQRQLCELYDRTGRGEDACKALDAAISCHSQDPEERWLQNILLSHFDMRHGDANAARRRLEAVRTEIAEKFSGKYPRQLDMADLELAQVLWAQNRREQALDILSKIHTGDVVLQKSILLSRFQWAVQTGIPGSDPIKAESQFQELSISDEDTRRMIEFGADLAIQELNLRQGKYELAKENLLHISERAIFMELIPISTRAQIMMASAEFEQGKFSECAVRAQKSAESFIEQCDEVSAEEAAVLVLRAQNSGKPDGPEKIAYQRLISDCEKYRKNGHYDGFCGLGMQIAFYAHEIGDTETCSTLLDQLGRIITPDHTAYDAMRLEQLRAAVTGKQSHLEKARKIAEINGFVLCTLREV